MFDRTCESCGKRYRVEDARPDEHWRKWSLEPAYVRCPFCNAVVEGLSPDTVDFARYFKAQYIFGILLFFCVFLIGVVTETLSIVAPIILASYGVWLARTAHGRDHRIIGWVLVGTSVTLVLGVAYVA